MSTTTTGKPRATSKEYGRRLYVEGAEVGHVDAMRRVPAKAMYDQRVEKMSEREKPYLSDDYDDMQYQYTPPELLPWAWDVHPHPFDPRTGVGAGAFPKPIPGAEWYWDWPCVIRCRSALACDGPVQCYPMMWSGDKKNLGFRVFIKEGMGGKWSAYSNWRYLPRLTKEEREKDPPRATDWPLIVNAPIGGWNSFPDKDRHYIQVNMVDAAKHKCHDDIGTVCYGKDCCVQPEYVVMTLDAAGTDDTIDNENPATVTVQDGCSSYNWSVSGTGFTIVPDGQSESMSAVVTASGGCGAATVTIIDKCGTTVTHQILHTTGSWVLKSSDVCVLSGTGTQIDWNSGHPIWELVVEEKKQVQILEYYGNAHSGCDPVLKCGDIERGPGSEWCDKYGLESEGVCLYTGVTWCNCYIDPPGSSTCHTMTTESLAYYEWECP